MNKNCNPKNEENMRFFLHIIPVDKDDLPEHRKRYGFDNLDFGFNPHQYKGDGNCIAARLLPDYDIARIRTGQYISSEGRLWRAEFQAGQ